MSDSSEDRIEEALEQLAREARKNSRVSAMGQLIEQIGCKLSGRKSSWWPDGSGRPPASIPTS